jgi:hypothetical protein
VSDGLATSGNPRLRATSPVGVACLALLTVAAAYALAAAPALATGQALLRAPASWLVAPLGARPVHQDGLATGAARYAEASVHALAASPVTAARESAGAPLPVAAPQAIVILVPALLVAVALALAH